MVTFPKQHSSRPGVTQSLPFTAASATVANPFGSQTYQIRLATTSACHYRIVEAAGGAAVATDTLLLTLRPEYLTVTPGQKISAIQDAVAGTLNVTEMS
jgi:hypothetical protein